MKKILFIFLSIISVNIFSKDFSLLCPVEKNLSFEIYVNQDLSNQYSYVARYKAKSKETIYPWDSFMNQVPLIDVDTYPNEFHFTHYLSDRFTNLLDIKISRKTLKANGIYRKSNKNKKRGRLVEYKIKDIQCSIFSIDEDNLI